MTDETPPNTPPNPWENTRPSGRKKSELDSLLDLARQYQKNQSSGGGNGNGSPPPSFSFQTPRAPKISVAWVMAIIIGLWLATGLYQVRPDQQGVVMRFGKKVGLTQPGLNYHLPYPFENVIIANTTRENRINFGFDPQHGDADVPSESLMLTGDENIVDVSVVVTWQVQDIGKFLFKVRDPEELTKITAESVFREVVAQSKMQDILTTSRGLIAAETKDKLQKLMDQYETGILITGVSLRDIAPPSQVVDAFREVQRAQADAEQAKNKALAYQNDILPKARGEASRMVAEAEGYQQSEVAKASGEAQQFDAIYSAYQNAKEVTQKRMYFEAMEGVFGRAKRIIIDKNAGANTIIPITLPTATTATVPNLLAPVTPAAMTPMPSASPSLEGN